MECYEKFYLKRLFQLVIFLFGACDIFYSNCRHNLFLLFVESLVLTEISDRVPDKTLFNKSRVVTYALISRCFIANCFVYFLQLYSKSDSQDDCPDRFDSQHKIRVIYFLGRAGAEFENKVRWN